MTLSGIVKSTNHLRWPCIFLRASVLLKESPSQRRSVELCNLSLPCYFRRPRQYFHASPKRNAEPFVGSARYLFPERLLIYHAGTGRTTFLAALKMTTVFVFGFFGFIVTPAYLSAEETPWSTTALAAAAAVCPLAFVTLTTAPIVTYIHLKIPPYARISREALTKWIKSRINPSTELDISSMTFLARPKQTTVAFGDLVPTRGLLNPANFKLQPGAASSPGPLIRRGGKWWASTPLREFCVSGFNKEAREPWVWDELQKQIRKGSKR